MVACMNKIVCGLVINDGVKTKGSYLSLFFGAFADNTCK